MTAPTTFREGIDSGVYVQAYPEAGGRLSGGTDQNGRYETMSFWVPWNERDNFQRLLLMTSQMSGGPDGDWIYRTPFKHPDYQNLYAQTIQWEPAGERFPTGSNPQEFPARYSDALCHVDFRPPNWSFNQQDDPNGDSSMGDNDDERRGLLNARQELKIAAEWIQIPNTSCKFSLDGMKIPIPISRRMTVLELVITWQKYPAQPLRKIRDFADTINLNPFLGCPSFTVLFLGCESQRESSVDGIPVQQVTMRFKYRPISWNRRYRPDKLVWDFVTDDDGHGLYEPVDFLPILLFGLPT